MIAARRLIALAVALLLGACASTDSAGEASARAASSTASQASSAKTSLAAAASNQPSGSDTEVASGEPEIEQVLEVASASSGADELVCRRVTRAGSHIPVRLCETRAESEAARRAAAELMRERSTRRTVLESDGAR